MIRRQSGFTLIEIMIAMAILAIISVLSAQTMKAGIQDREAVENEIASDSKVSDAMRIIRTDINSAYHYRDIFIAIQNAAIKAPAPAAANGAAAAPPPALGGGGAAAPGGYGQPAQPAQANAEPDATPRPTPPDVTGFIGDSQSMYFTTLSNVRTLQDSQVSDQAKIGYYIKSCSVQTGAKKIASKCLYRSLSPYLDEQVDTPGDETVLLDHVDQFKLRFLGPGRGTSTDLEYVDTWKTGKNGDAISKVNFPYAVEVTLSTDNKDDPKQKRVTASALIPIRFPNNPPKQKNGQPATEESLAADAQAAAQQAAGAGGAAAGGAASGASGTGGSSGAGGLTGGSTTGLGGPGGYGNESGGR